MKLPASEKIFRLDRPVWSYAGRTLLIMLITLVPVFILSTVFIATVPSLSLSARSPLFRGRNIHHAHVGCLARHGT